MAHMQSYRRKGDNRAEAIELTNSNAKEIASLCGGAVIDEEHPITRCKDEAVNVPTLEGVKRLSMHNDTILIRVNGRFNVVSKHEFYEEFELNTRS